MVQGLDFSQGDGIVLQDYAGGTFHAQAGGNPLTVSADGTSVTINVNGMSFARAERPIAADEAGDDIPAEEMPAEEEEEETELVATEREGLPIPRGCSQQGTENTMFRATVTATHAAPLAKLLSRVRGSPDSSAQRRRKSVSARTIWFQCSCDSRSRTAAAAWRTQRRV